MTPSDEKRAWSPLTLSPARSAEHHIDLAGPTAGAADLSSMTASCAAFWRDPRRRMTQLLSTLLMLRERPA